jgi:hypothetical protein
LTSPEIENRPIEAGLPDGFFQTKNPNFDTFCRLWNGKLGIFYGNFWYFQVHLVYFTSIWYILRYFGIYFPTLVHKIKKDLATQHDWRQKGNTEK